MADDHDARDKAIAAVQALQLPWLRIDDTRVGYALDAIPGDVLVDLAIERGELMEIHLGDHRGSPLYRRATDGGGDG